MHLRNASVDPSLFGTSTLGVLCTLLGASDGRKIKVPFHGDGSGYLEDHVDLEQEDLWPG